MEIVKKEDIEDKGGNDKQEKIHTKKVYFLSSKHKQPFPYHSI